LEGNIGPELIKEVLFRGEAAVGFADAGGTEDYHPGEALAGDEVEGVVKGAEDDLAVLVD